MKVYARGWKRDHGAKDIAVGDVTKAIRDDNEVETYSQGDTYVRLLLPRHRLKDEATLQSERDIDQLRVRVSLSGRVNLNGRYQILCDLTKSEVADLFQLMHAEDTLDQIIANLNKVRMKRNGRRL